MREREEMLKSVQRNRVSRLDLMGESRLASRQKFAHVPSMSEAVALQDKSPRLARPLARGLNSRLNPVARSSRQNALFGKN